MERERYRLRHPSLRDLVGPYSLSDLRAAIDAKSFPIDSYVLRDDGQDESALRASPHWRPVTDVLGLPRPNAPQPPAAPPPGPRDEAVARLRRLRERTAYGGLRGMIGLIAVVYVVTKCVIALLGLFGIGLAGDAGAAVEGFGIVVLLAWTCVEVLIVIVVAALAKALLDIADCALARD